MKLKYTLKDSFKSQNRPLKCIVNGNHAIHLRPNTRQTHSLEGIPKQALHILHQKWIGDENHPIQLKEPHWSSKDHVKRGSWKS